MIKEPDAGLPTAEVYRRLCHVKSTILDGLVSCHGMSKIPYAHHRFPPEVIQRAVWLYFRFPLSFRDVEEMLAERGIDVSYVTIRRWIVSVASAFEVPR